MLNLIGLVKLRSGKFNESLEQFSKGLEINQNTQVPLLRRKGDKKMRWPLLRRWKREESKRRD